MISEETADCGTSSLHCSNPFVNCCSVNLYEAMIDYATTLVKSKRSPIEPLDLVHELLLDNSLNETNYKTKIKAEFFKEVNSKSCIDFYNEEFTIKKRGVNFLSCKKCMESLPSDAFYKRGIWYETTCKKCNQEAERLRREELNDRYVKKIILDKRCPDNDVSDIGIEIKKTELLLTRISRTLKYKDYAHRRTKKSR